jgi:hypothetical protein
MAESNSRDESDDEESEREEESSDDEESKGEEESSDDEEASSASDEESPDSDDDRPRKPPSRRSGKLSKRARREEQAKQAKKDAMIRALVVGGVALAVGGAAGWFGHIEQAKAKIRAESAPAAAGSAGPCGAWEKKICSSSGDESAPCQQAKGATGLLTPGTCELALEALPATLAKVKAERAPCESLVTKLCKDVSESSKGCNMVKQRTPSFPVERCKELLANYDQVLTEVRRIDENPMPMGMPGHGADDGHGH